MAASYVEIKLTQISSLEPGDVIRLPEDTKLGWIKIEAVTPKSDQVVEITFDYGGNVPSTVPKKPWSVVEIITS